MQYVLLLERFYLLLIMQICNIWTWGWHINVCMRYHFLNAFFKTFYAAHNFLLTITEKYLCVSAHILGYSSSNTVITE